MPIEVTNSDGTSSFIEKDIDYFDFENQDPYAMFPYSEGTIENFFTRCFEYAIKKNLNLTLIT